MKKNMILHTIAKRLLRNGRITQGNCPLVRADEITAHSPRHYGSLPTTLRLAVTLLLMMTLGVGTTWGQTDYSGTYYIASDAIVSSSSTYDPNTPANNYYLCPTEGWCYYEAPDNYTGTDNGQPFLTTYKWRDGVNDNKAIWIVEKHPTLNYYYFKQHIEGDRYKYLMLNGKISGTSSNGKNRMRVHLEEHVEDTDNPTSKALFSIDPASSPANAKSVIITPKDTENEDGKHKYLVVNSGNANALTGQSGKGDGPGSSGEQYQWTKGIIGLYFDGKDGMDVTAPFYFENNPTISYTNQNEIRITYFDYADNEVEIHYTTNGDTPTASSTLYEGEFDPPAGTTTIKAIAIKDGKESGIATFTPPVFLGSTHKYLIQSQNFNTTNVSWTEPCYYMIPSDADNNSNITVNTTTLLQPSMEWYFLNAGIESDVQYYYIVNNTSKDNENHPYYLCYDSGVFMRVFDSENANKFKFSIVQYPTTGIPTGYNLKPYGQTSYIHKSNGNNSQNAITLNSSNNSSGASIWKFIKKADLPASLPFNVSDNSKTYYYKLSTHEVSDYFITPSTTNEYVTTYNTASDNQNWYFEQAEAATDADWLTYYHIRNAITGEYLYYNGAVNGDNHSNAFELHSSIGNETDRYKFAMTRAIHQDRWFIVPKVLKNTQFAYISTMWRDNNNALHALKTQKTRDNVHAMWQFTVSNFCLPPFFEESNGNITISCDTKGAEIHFLTDGNNPTEASTLYNNNNWSSSNQVRIKAIAVIKEDEAVTASSAVVTLLNKPDITLEAGPYEYKGTAWEPSLTVSIGESGSETTAPSSPATYTATYSSNVNVGTAAITLTDADPTDSWYIWNGSTTFTITQKAITITAASDTKGYDGTPLTNSGYTCSPALATGDSFESVTVTGSQTDVGSSSNVPSAAVIKNESDEDVTANYAITYTNGTLTVTLRSIGDGSLASGFTLEFGEGGTIILKDGEITLIKDTDYSIGSETTSESGKYSQRTVSGIGNYEGSFSIRNANVNFQNDGNGGTEYSATFVAENAAGPASNDPANGHALPEGITAYIITSISGNNANAETLGYIPEGIPVLLLSNAASAGFLVQDASGHTEITSTQISNNMLEEVTDNPSKHFNTREIYLLYKNEFVYNMDGYLAKGKVYLNPGHAAPSPSRLFIAWGHSTGIEDSQLSPLTAHHSGWYPLDGRRLNGKPAKKGLYIMDGKKKFMK